MNSPLTTKPRHVPLRTCLVCRRKTAKTALLRLCQDENGRVQIDKQQRLPGRGAYVCFDPACAQLLIKKQALHHGFRAPVAREDYAKVVEFIQKDAA